MIFDGMTTDNCENFEQSHFIEVARWEIFMEQESRFGLDLGRFGNFGFFMFLWAKFFLKTL